ncbi:MAG TPA: sugar phosphate nucleotidyltransferase [Chthonomonadales bacterium]|nr:sugar phosphate nucleotidyltransferase [Chthonomonadales bacterium]
MSVDTNSGGTSPIHKAVVPAAGLGTRLAPLTLATPKELLPIGRLPVLGHVANELREAGITDVLFIVSTGKRQIPDYFGSCYHTNHGALRCEYVVQDEPLGAGDAVLSARDWVGCRPVVIAFGDSFISRSTASEAEPPLARLIRAHQQRKASATVLVEHLPREKVSSYGVVAPAVGAMPGQEEAFRIDRIVEKPVPAEAPSTYTVAARFVVDPDLFRHLEVRKVDERGEQNLPNALNALGEAGGALYAQRLRHGEKRWDIGNFESYFTGFTSFALNDREVGGAVKRALLDYAEPAEQG